MGGPSSSVAAILLTGGASRRMGRDKSLLIVDGTTLAVRTAALLHLVVESAVEVGPGASGLPHFSEPTPGEGPLVAIVEGRRALREMGQDGAALVVACDMPLLSEGLLRFLVEWDSPGSVVPVVDRRPQPLCAKWGARDLDAAEQAARSGVRSLHFLASQPEVALLDESRWRGVIDPREFADVDSPDDLLRLGITS